ncbi:MAG: 50S ribosomal protein L9, partial [bacterium]|nr:50S ribosomal protein L9 [bacterium]
SESALKVLAENLKQRAHKIAKIKADAEAAAAALEGVSLTIAAKVSANGTIFGSVGNIQVAEALEQAGHNVDRKLIVVKDTIKEVGNYTATIKLHKEVSVEIPFEVVAE